jgi:hypothetical protein
MSDWTAALPDEVVLAPGETFRIELRPSALGAGYQWVVIDPGGIDVAIDVIDDDLEGPTSSSEEVGPRSGGRVEVLQLRAEGPEPGATTVELALKRDWAPDEPLARHRIRVVPATGRS